MAKVKNTVWLGGKERRKMRKGNQKREEWQKDAIKWVGKSMRELRKAMQEAAKARGDAKHRPYHLHPGSKATLWDMKISENYWDVNA